MKKSTLSTGCQHFIPNISCRYMKLLLSSQTTTKVILWFTVWTCLILPAAYASSTERDVNILCPTGDALCKEDPFGFESINLLHQSIDDDQSGDLDRSESDEFIRDELKYEDGFDRQVNFHGSDDLISIHDLWRLWTHSTVYNWTVEDVVDWLVQDVELPQYEENFRVNGVDGHILPRLAANPQYMTSILGIKSGVHKQKVSVKATDLVLFGPPKRHSYVKDLALVISLVVALGGCWLAYMQHKYSQDHIRKVMRELESLQKAEDNLHRVQQKLDTAEKVQQNVEEEKQNLEKKLQEEIDAAKREAERLRQARETTAEEMSSLKLAEAELVQVRMALRDAERQHVPLGELQHWLQLTYEMESIHYQAKRDAAEKELMIAKDMCERIRRKRSAFLGSFRVAHTSSIDDTDQYIMKAKASLEDAKIHLQERAQRWSHIEKICGFCITQNLGLQCLESLLRGGVGGMTRSGSSAAFGNYGMAGVSVDEADGEDLTPGQFAAAGGDTRVWPNLMRAGMQLTMFGLGLTNPRLQGVHPMMPGYSDPRDRRSAALASGFTGSSNSLSVVGGGLPQGVTLRHRDSLTSKSLAGTVNCATDSKAGGVTDVKFNLGDVATDGSFDNGRPRSSSYGTTGAPAPKGLPHSSFDSATAAAAANAEAARLRSLKTSLSESALAVVQKAGSNVNHGNGILKRMSHEERSLATRPLHEEASGQESTDSGSTECLASQATPTPGAADAKQKKKLLKTIFKGSSKRKDKDKAA